MSRTAPRRLAWVASLVSASSILLGAGQQPPRYEETVNVASVLIDVRVLDDQGAPIVGLKADDFSVQIGGRAAQVRSSAWIGVERMSSHEIGHGGALSAVPEVREGRVIVLLFQRSLANAHARGLIRMLEQSRNLVRDLGPLDRVAVLTFDTNLKIWSDFTQDHLVLDRILQRGVLFERPPAVAPSPGLSLVAKLRTHEGRRTDTIEGAFKRIAHALESIPGSKTVAFFGHSMGSLNMAGDVSAGTHYRDARRALTAARVTVFSIDITLADAHSLAFGLQQIAHDTGGFYATSIDFPDRPMRWLSGALSGYYVLFVDRPEHADAARAVTVTLTRRDAYVFATTSYSNAVR